MLCADDAHVREILPEVTKPVLTYGTGEDAMVRAEAIEHDGGRMRFRALRKDAKPLDVVLNLPGRHNVLNALAAIAVATEIRRQGRGHPEGAARIPRRRPALPELRRDQLDAKGQAAFTLIDDYGHHPAEMAATIEAARGAFPGRRIVLAFQPHRYTRTRDLFEDFVRVLSSVDVLLLAEVYAGGRGADRRRRRPLARARGARRGQGGAAVRRGHRRHAGRDPARAPRTATSSSPWAPARSAACRRSWQR